MSASGGPGGEAEQGLSWDLGGLDRPLDVRLGQTLLLGELVVLGVLGWLHCHLLLRGLNCHLPLSDERGQLGQAEERLAAERLRRGWLGALDRLLDVRLGRTLLLGELMVLGPST